MLETYLSKGIKRTDMKFELGSKNTLSLFIGFLILLPSITMVIQFTQAFDRANPSQNIDLGNPFLVEHYQINTGKPETTNNSILLNFTGKGIINSAVNILQREMPLRSLETMTHPISTEKQSMLLIIKI
jgi:hypothetical protein